MKVRQVWEDDFRGCRPNRPDTVRSDISIPSLSSSPWILGAAVFDKYIHQRRLYGKGKNFNNINAS